MYLSWGSARVWEEQTLSLDILFETARVGLGHGFFASIIEARRMLMSFGHFSSGDIQVAIQRTTAKWDFSGVITK